MRSVAVFLDRDGTICRDVHYMFNPAQFELLPGAAEGINLLNDMGVKVIVVTNQSGIARGYVTEEALEKIHEKMINELLKREARIDSIYYCPHHPNDNCGCRKPRIGMLEKAATDFGLDLSKCFVVGDQMLDVEAGRNAGCTSILIRTPETEPNADADYVVPNLYEAAGLVSKLNHLRTKTTTQRHDKSPNPS